MNREDFSYEQRLSVALLYLVSQFARRLLNGMDRRVPKAIFLDEAWAITSTPEGAKLVPEVSRMGRSRNTALILVSQNAGDLLAEQVTNCISSVFAFRSSERVEVANVMALLGVEASAEHQAVLRGLGNGECLFRDLEGRAGRIAIDLISEEMQRWLDTNPTRARPGEPAPGATAAGREPGPAPRPPGTHGPSRGTATPHRRAHSPRGTRQGHPRARRDRLRRPLGTYEKASRWEAGYRVPGRREIQRGGRRLPRVSYAGTSRSRAGPRIDQETRYAIAPGQPPCR